jgi:hypothetical protein
MSALGWILGVALVVVCLGSGKPPRGGRRRRFGSRRQPARKAFRKVWNSKGIMK